MKITVITGSPRKHGNSFAMTDAFIREAETLGHTVRRFKRNKRTQSLQHTAKSPEGADCLPAAPSCCIECHAFLLPMAQHTPLIDIFRLVW